MSKDVKILVDVANSMASVVTVDYERSPQTTYLNVAQNITLNLLQTFMPQDSVEVFSFNTNGAASLVGQVQIGTSYNYSYDADPADRPELAAMTAHVNSLAASANAAQSDLTTALVQVVNSFNTTDTLKVGTRIPSHFATSPSHHPEALSKVSAKHIFLLSDLFSEVNAMHEPKSSQFYNLSTILVFYHRMESLNQKYKHIFFENWKDS